MKVVLAKQPPCACIGKLWDYYNSLATTLGVGSVVECDCGRQYTLEDSQRDGLFWVKKSTCRSPQADSAWLT